MRCKKVTIEDKTFNSIKQALAYYNTKYSVFLSRRRKGYSLEEAIRLPERPPIKLDIPEDKYIHQIAVQFSVEEGYVWNIIHIKHVKRALVEQYLILDRRLTNYKNTLKELKDQYEKTQDEYYNTKCLLSSFTRNN